MILTFLYFGFSIIAIIFTYFGITKYLRFKSESFKNSIPIYEIERSFKISQINNRKKHYKLNQIMRKYNRNFFRYEKH